MTQNVARLHIGAEEMSASFRYVRATSLPPHSSCPYHVSKRSEAPWHVSDDAQPSCVLPATVWLLVRAHLDQAEEAPAGVAAVLGSIDARTWVGIILGIAAALGAATGLDVADILGEP